MKCIQCGAIMDKIGEGTYRCSECNHAVSDCVYRPSNCDIPMPQGFGKQKGWICPACGRGVAPWVDYCPCRINRKVTYVSGTGTIGTYVNDNLSEYAKYATTDRENADLLESNNTK